MKRNFDKNWKANEAREKRSKEDLSPREEKQNLWEKHINMWEEDLLIWAIWQMAAKCVKKEVSLVHYEDETW